MSNGKDLDYFSPEKENGSSEMADHLKDVRDRLPAAEIKDPHKVETEQIPPRNHNSKKEILKSSKELFLYFFFLKHNIIYIL